MKEIQKIVKAMAADDETVYSAFHKLAVSRPNDICFFSGSKNWTYREVSHCRSKLCQSSYLDVYICMHIFGF